MSDKECGIMLRTVSGMPIMRLSGIVSYGGPAEREGTDPALQTQALLLSTVPTERWRTVTTLETKEGEFVLECSTWSSRFRPETQDGCAKVINNAPRWYTPVTQLDKESTALLREVVQRYREEVVKKL